MTLHESLESDKDIDKSQLQKILVIYAGGTFGQKLNSEGNYEASGQKTSPIDINSIRGIDELAQVESFPYKDIDSTEMSTSDRANIANIIYEKYDDYKGFVIIHGTDTMVDTACALNYMLRGLKKTIVLTGSQIPIFQHDTDAENNLKNAITAASYGFNEVVIVFDKKVLKGCRSTKISEEDFDAFASPRSSPLGFFNTRSLIINPNEYHSKKIYRKPTKFIEFDSHVEFYQQVSGSDSRIFEKIVESDDVHGIVIGGFGAGNVRSKYYLSIEKAVESGKPVIVTTSCLKGFAEMGKYEPGKVAKKLGAISANDMTREAACQKLMYALGLAQYKKLEERKKLEFICELIQDPINDDINN